MTNTKTPRLQIVAQVMDELDRAQTIHGPYPTLHHGLSVLEEEVDELRREVYKKEPDPIKLREEAIQVAATAIRFIKDLL